MITQYMSACCIGAIWAGMACEILKTARRPYYTCCRKLNTSDRKMKILFISLSLFSMAYFRRINTTIIECNSDRSIISSNEIDGVLHQYRRIEHLCRDKETATPSLLQACAKLVTQMARHRKATNFKIGDIALSMPNCAPSPRSDRPASRYVRPASR